MSRPTTIAPGTLFQYRRTNGRPRGKSLGARKGSPSSAEPPAKARTIYPDRRGDLKNIREFFNPCPKAPPSPAEPNRALGGKSKISPQTDDRLAEGLNKLPGRAALNATAKSTLSDGRTGRDHLKTLLPNRRPTGRGAWQSGSPKGQPLKLYGRTPRDLPSPARGKPKKFAVKHH